MALVAEGKNESLGAKSVILCLNTEGGVFELGLARIFLGLTRIRDLARLNFSASQNKEAERDFVAFGFFIQCQCQWASPIVDRRRPFRAFGLIFTH